MLTFLATDHAHLFMEIT